MEKIRKNMVSGQEWKDMITGLKSQASGIKKVDEAELQQTIIDAVGKRTEHSKIGVLFSGGVDSSTIALILKNLGKDFTCYAVGLKDAEDIEWAERAAKELGFELKTRILSDNDVEIIIKKLAEFLPEFDILKAGVGCVTYAASELAKQDGCDVVFTGLGSEEIFAGYQRHLESNNVNEECWKGLLDMHDRDFMRDLPIAEKIGIKIETPLLDKEVIRIAMSISGEEKLDNNQNKIIFRKIAEKIGLPNEFAQRKKRAAQYGSRFDKAIQRIAKKNGFARKAEYIKSLTDKPKVKK